MAVDRSHRRSVFQALEGVDRVQSACKMQYDAGAWRLKPRCARRGDAMADPRQQDGRYRREDFHRQGRAAGLADAGARQSPRPRHRRDRNRKDRLAAGDGGRICARRRSGIRGRHQGRPLRHLRSRRGQGFYRQAGQRYGPQLPARPVFDGILGRVRRAGPSGARHRLRNGAAAAVAHDGSERCPGRRAEHRLPRRRRARAAAARHEGSAGDAGCDRPRRRQERRDGDAMRWPDPQGRAIRQCLQGDRRNHPAPASGAGKPGRDQVLRRAGAGAEGFHAHRQRRPGHGQHPGGGQADAEPAAVRDLPAVDAVGTVRRAAGGRRSAEAQARVLLRRGASVVQRCAEGADGQDRAGGAADPLQGRRASIS